MVDVVFKENYGSFLPFGVIALGALVLIALVMAMRVPEEKRHGWKPLLPSIVLAVVGIALMVASMMFGISHYGMTPQSEADVAAAIAKQENVVYVGTDTSGDGMLYLFADSKTKKLMACKFDTQPLAGTDKLVQGPRGDKTFSLPYTCIRQQ